MYYKKTVTWSSFSSESVIEVNLYELLKRYSFTKKFKALFSCGLRASWATDFSAEVVGVFGSDSKKDRKKHVLPYIINKKHEV